MSKKYKQPKHIRLVKTLKNDLIEGIQEELEYKDRNEIDFYDYIFEFVDNYAPYTNDQINLISALMKHPAVDLEEVEDAIEESTTVAQLYFNLTRTYLEQNVTEKEAFELGRLSEDEREEKMVEERISESRNIRERML